MKQFLSEEELNLELQFVDFVIDTQRQIAKDFQLSGIAFPIDFSSEERNYIGIIDQVSAALLDVIRLGERHLQQLLYQIDIPQNDFLNMIGNPDFIDRMSDLIVRREAYKVWLRRNL